MKTNKATKTISWKDLPSNADVITRKGTTGLEWFEYKGMTIAWNGSDAIQAQKALQTMERKTFKRHEKHFTNQTK